MHRKSHQFVSFDSLWTFFYLFRDLWLFIANKYVETGDGLVFRSGADQFLEKSSKRCENQNWEYKDQIVCSNGYLDGSLCHIEGVFQIVYAWRVTLIKIASVKWWRQSQFVYVKEIFVNGFIAWIQLNQHAWINMMFIGKQSDLLSFGDLIWVSLNWP